MSPERTPPPENALSIPLKTQVPWCVYLVRCRDSSLYTGITNDLDRRIQKHNSGRGSRYTRSRLPVVLVYQEMKNDRSLALKRELAIKRMTRRDKELLIQSHGPTALPARNA